MLKERFLTLLKENGYSEDVQRLVSSAIDAEQTYISYELKSNSNKLREIKDAIREEVQTIIKDL